MRKLLTALAAVLLLGLPAPAVLAQDNAAVDEYTEAVPGGGGENPSDEGGAGKPLPADTAAALDQAGADGAAAAELAQSTGGPERAAADAERKVGSSGSRADGDGVTSAISEVVNPESDSGMGVVLPIVLGAALLAAIAFAIARSRGSRTPA